MGEVDLKSIDFPAFWNINEGKIKHIFKVRKKIEVEEWGSEAELQTVGVVAPGDVGAPPGKLESPSAPGKVTDSEL